MRIFSNSPLALFFISLSSLIFLSFFLACAPEADIVSPNTNSNNTNSTRDPETIDVSLTLDSYSSPVSIQSGDTVKFTTPTLDRTQAYRIEVSNTSGHTGSYFDMSLAWTNGTLSPEQGRLTDAPIFPPTRTGLNNQSFLAREQYIYLPKSNDSYVLSIYFSNNTANFSLKISVYNPMFTLTNREYTNLTDYTAGTYTTTVKRHLLSTNMNSRPIGDETYYVSYMPSNASRMNFEIITNGSDETNANAIPIFASIDDPGNRIIRVRDSSGIVGVLDIDDPSNSDFVTAQVKGGVFFYIIDNAQLNLYYNFPNKDCVIVSYSE